jgi:hypothetical protein
MSDDTIRMTYSELAQARGITIATARRMTTKHKWSKQLGNDGLARVLVPRDAIGASLGSDTRAAEAAPATGPGPMADVVSAAVRPLEGALAALREQLDRAHERAERAERQVAEQAAELVECRLLVGKMVARLSRPWWRRWK